MSVTDAQMAHLLLALGVLLAAAHTGGFLASKLRQPPVIGEITAGILLGPTLLGRLSPGSYDFLFAGSAAPATGPVLGAVYQFGMLLLMFVSGAEMRPRPGADRHQNRLIASITAFGTVLPFAAGLLYPALFDVAPLMGTAGEHTALVLVIGIAVAVTSIPVISRILLDLGLMATSFARVVLSAAVLEDSILYLVLGVALHTGSSSSLLGHVATTVAFVAVTLLAGPRLFRWGVTSPMNVVHRRSPLGALLLFILGVTTAAAWLGLAPLIGALVAGLVAGVATGEDPVATQARDAVKSFAFAFFVPIYFAIVGLRLDLGRDLDLRIFALFFAWAGIAKFVSVWLGARVAREPNPSAVNLAVAMSARGGPGIVLASVAYDAGIISRELQTVLVLFALATSAAAGAWLASQRERLYAP